MTARTWRIKSKKINETIAAGDQWAAWDTLRGRPITDFGLVVTAESAKGGDDQVAVKTSQLMQRWGREDDAYLFVQAARAAGLVA